MVARSSLVGFKTAHLLRISSSFFFGRPISPSTDIGVGSSVHDAPENGRTRKCRSVHFFELFWWGFLVTTRGTLIRGHPKAASEDPPARERRASKNPFGTA